MEPDELKGARPAREGGSPGHSRSKHGFTKELETNIINNADRKFIGAHNKSGRKVNVFWKNGDVVITEADNTNRIITGYGRSATKGSNKPVDPTKFDKDPLLHEIE